MYCLPNYSLFCFHTLYHYIGPSGCQCRTRCQSKKTCPCKCVGQSCLPSCHLGHSCTNTGQKATSPPIDLTITTKPDSQESNRQTSQTTTDQRKWKNCCGIHLTKRHKEILLYGDWLDDDIINATQFMLKQQHPEVGGLQSTTLSEKFAMEPQSGEFVQVLLINKNHWITISTIGCKRSSINVFDSLHGYLPQHAQKLVADIMMSPDHAIEVGYIDVQWQSGASDCGIFAVPFATSLCFGIDPATLSFDQQQMRSHLVSCIESEHIMPFPTRGVRRNLRKPQVKYIAVYCICRLIDDGTPMVQCATCNDWFHTGCVQVPQEFLTNKGLEWNCTKCSY